MITPIKQFLARHCARVARDVSRLMLLSVWGLPVVSFAQPAVSDAASASNPQSFRPMRGAWADAHRSPDQRAAAALAAMTPEEELSLLSTTFPALAQMLSGGSVKLPGGVPLSAGYIRAIPRLGLADVAETDASLGVSNTSEMRKGDFATALPAGLALGASFDPALAYQGGRMIGSEARAKGFGVMLAGGVNIVRDPRGGRDFEYLSEDPYLSGLLAGRAIAGIQSNHIVSTMKHYAVNATETGRFVYNVNLDEAALRESDLLAFQIAQEIGRPGSVMCAYNKLNEVFACENRFLLSTVLKQDWHFPGFVMSDWGAVHSTGSLLAGLDQESGYQADKHYYLGSDLGAALSEGRVHKVALDRAALRVLRTLFAFGVYDSPPVAGAINDLKTDAAVAQTQAEAGIVLLKNENGVLPIAPTTRRIAVVGAHADIGVLFGGGSAQVMPVGGDKLVIRPSKLGPSSFGWRTYGGTSPLDALKAQFPNTRIDFAQGTDQAAVVALAAHADLTIVFVEKWATEGSDQSDLSLGEGQDELIDALARANPKTIVVLQTGNPVLMPWRNEVAGILEAWFPGQRGAEAIARVLSGDVNPSGRLPITFPASVDQLPNPKLPGTDVPSPPTEGVTGFEAMLDKLPFTITFPEGSDVGYRWFDRTKMDPLYPFGYGLSYTHFDHAQLDASGGRRLRVSFRVINRGSRSGVDVPQVYVTSAGKAKRLIGWGRVLLAPGQSRTVTVQADPRVLADFDPATHDWVVRTGDYKVEMANSANEPVLHATVHLSGFRVPDRPQLLASAP